jgi:pimeloyl-ACP methyl ester carboxylesterase
MDGYNILALPGWAQPHDALHSIAPHATHFDYVNHANIESIAGALAGRKYDAVIGWSLGGVIARQLITRGDLLANALISIASPYQFVRDVRLHDAMPPDTFEQFYANYRDDSERTAKRFHGLLVKGDSRMKELLGLLRTHPKVTQNRHWLPWLDFLNHYSAHDHSYQNLPPTLLLHGRNDSVVPFSQSERLQEKLPHATLIAYDEAAHVPHLHAPDTMKSHINDFLKKVLP